MFTDHPSERSSLFPKLSALCLFAFLLVFLSIRNEAMKEQSNPVFARFNPLSIEYKQELVRQLSSRKGEELNYWFNRYFRMDGKDYIDVTIKGDGLNASSAIQINDWTKLKEIKENNGKGYHGAELQDLKFDIVKSGSNVNFVFKDLNAVID